MKRKPPPAKKPGETTVSAPVDLGDSDVVYDVRLTGGQIDIIATLFDQVVRANGIAVALQLTPVLEAVTRTRKAALQRTAATLAAKKPK